MKSNSPASVNGQASRCPRRDGSRTAPGTLQPPGAEHGRTLRNPADRLLLPSRLPSRSGTASSGRRKMAGQRERCPEEQVRGRPRLDREGSGHGADGEGTQAMRRLPQLCLGSGTYWL